MNNWTFDKAGAKIIADWKFDKSLPNAALKLPVTTNNFKEMIHGIHAGRDRVMPFQDARDATSRGVIQLLDFRRMDFPGKLNNCETCHVTAASTAQKTYNFIPANSLMTTFESVNVDYAAGILAGTATPAMAKASLATANAADRVTTPYAGACVSCHDNAAVKAHILSLIHIFVTTVPTTTATTVTGTRPSTDNTGKLEAVAGKDGSYKYTFYRDITAVKAQIAGMTLTGNNRAADLGDLTYTATLPHRLTIQILSLIHI